MSEPKKWDGWKDTRRTRPLSSSELERDDDDHETNDAPRAEHGAVTWDAEALDYLREHDQ